MKYILILLLFITGNAVGQTSPKLDSLCLQRGHWYEPAENSDTTLYTGLVLKSESGWGDYYPLYELRLIDSPDSSYIIRRQLSKFKFCYRCHRDIEFKKKQEWVKTIWRKQ